MAHFNLKEQQEYYRYPSSGWTYKNPPRLDPMITEYLKRERLADNYRFVWLGVDVIRLTEDDPNPVVKGDRNACMTEARRMFHNVNGVVQSYFVPWLRPKKVFVTTRQPRHFAYDNRGHRCITLRPDLLPAGVFGSWEYIYHTFGALEWRIERRVGDKWFSIQTIRAKNGLYQNPSILHCWDLKKRDHEDRNRSDREIAEISKQQDLARQELQAQQQAAEEADEKAAVDEVVYSILDHAERAPASTNQ